MQKVSVGIIGIGMVGGALARWFEAAGHRVFRFDLYKNIGSSAEVNRAEVIFIAVPTPFNEARSEFDPAEIERALTATAGGKIVVIKSTVLPGITERLQRSHPSKRLLFSPEFLSEQTADYDMAHPLLNIVGYTEASRDHAADIMALFARAPFERIMPSHEAELYKYLRNAFFATKVVFFNQIYDLCERLGLDYEALRECAANDPWVAPGGQHTVVWHKGYRGYAGKCLPKDVKAFVRFGEGYGVLQELLRTVEAVNQRLREIPPRTESGSLPKPETVSLQD